jgi:hypothetical protein
VLVLQAHRVHKALPAHRVYKAYKALPVLAARDLREHKA